MDSSLHKTATDAAAAWVGKTYPAADHLMTEALSQRFIAGADFAYDGGRRVDLNRVADDLVDNIIDAAVARRHAAAFVAGARWVWDEAPLLPITDPAAAPKAIPAARQLAHEILAAASDPTPGDPAVPDDVKARVADELRRLADEYDPRPVTETCLLHEILTPAEVRAFNERLTFWALNVARAQDVDVPAPYRGSAS